LQYTVKDEVITTAQKNIITIATVLGILALHLSYSDVTAHEVLYLRFGPIWSRDGKTLLLDSNATKSTDPLGPGSYWIVNNTGQSDWALDVPNSLLPLVGEIWELHATVSVDGQAAVSAGFAWSDDSGTVIDWVAGASTRDRPGKQNLVARWLITKDGQSLRPRIVGWGAGQVTVENPRVLRMKAPYIETNQTLNHPSIFTAGNYQLILDQAKNRWRISTTEKTIWEGSAPQGLVYLRTEDESLIYYHPLSNLLLVLTITASSSIPEWSLTWTPRGDAQWQGYVDAGPRWSSNPNQRLILPLNQGVDVPVSHQTFPSLWFAGAGGHGLALPFWSLTTGNRQLITLIQDPEDAILKTHRVDGLLNAYLAWRPSMGRWNGSRRITIAVVESDGVTELAKWYRQKLIQTNQAPRPWKKKFDQVPAAKRLLGAANVYIEGDSTQATHDIQKWGWDRVLWSGWAQKPFITESQSKGWLVGRYDIYQDVMNPKVDPHYQPHMNSAWPNDILLDSQGDWVRGWVVRYPDGRKVPTGVLDDRRAIDYARPLIADELSQKPFLARFIDTTTATDLQENYRPKKEMDRRQSRAARLQLLYLLSEDFKLVTGSEKGTFWATDAVHYFEGSMGLGPFRDPDAGYTMGDIIDPPPPEALFNIDHTIRVPLWELIFRDSVVSYWYWGDGNNKFPAHWMARDRFNILYATPPLYYFRTADWNRMRDMIRDSYARIRQATMAADIAIMVSFEYVTSDRQVQRTVFSNGTIITMNWSQKTWSDNAGLLLGAGAWAIATVGR